MTAGSDNFVEAMKSMPPMGRSATVEYVAHVVMFLSSDEASYLSGSICRSMAALPNWVPIARSGCARPGATRIEPRGNIGSKA